MFKGLAGIKKAVKGGISAVAENTSSLAEQERAPICVTEYFLPDM